MNKVIYPDYNCCITNLACSIMKYFDLEIKHNTIKEMDELLRAEPKNVVVILYDGMGSNILRKTLKPEDFFYRNLIKDISSVAPATTTAATTSMMSGLNPIEHGWLGWDLYVQPIDKIVTMFLNTMKDTDIIVGEESVAKKYFPYERITSRIHNAGKYVSKILIPFEEEPYVDIDDMYQRIITECKKDGKKYIYAYCLNPDSVMHDFGTDSDEAKQWIQILNNRTEELANELEDTLLIITADHGHLNCDSITLSTYKDLFAFIEGNTWIEGRTCTFRVRDENKEKFEELFYKYFKDDFILKTKQEIIEDKLFGDGEQHALFESSLGDYFALGITNKYFRYNEKSVNLKSMHAGYMEDEMLIPLIGVLT